jgi:Raf kinase inhibitor-like YbhB/YbcL family protein
MTVITTAWPDGGQIPAIYTQSGAEKSPGVQWSGAPAGTQSYVLIFHDLDTGTGNSVDDILHWLVWNIPATVTAIPPDQPDGFDLPNGLGKQISVSGSRYRGPGAPAAGPYHHYLLELYALDTMLQVDPAPQAPNGTPGAVNPGVATRASVTQAMEGRIRGKAAYVGLFRRSS